MKIATFNLQNRYMQDNKLTDVEYIEKLTEFINNNQIDILGVQELVYGIRKKLLKKYSLFGNSRFHLLKHFKYNEYNSIITDLEVINTKTYMLPYFGSVIPRIATEVIVNSNNKMIRIINTHLCLYRYHKVKIKELNKLLEIIKKEDIPTIIMGDFNLRDDSNEFKYFCEELNKLNIRYVKNKEFTYKNRILDYMFASKNIDIGKVEVIESGLSDHKILIANMYIK